MIGSKNDGGMLVCNYSESDFSACGSCTRSENSLCFESLILLQARSKFKRLYRNLCVAFTWHGSECALPWDLSKDEGHLNTAEANNSLSSATNVMGEAHCWASLIRLIIRTRSQVLYCTPRLGFSGFFRQRDWSASWTFSMCCQPISLII